jgi:hypothetical protein
MAPANFGSLDQITMTQDKTLATNLNLYVNGMQVSGAAGAPSSLNLGASGFAIGEKYSNTSEFWNGTISEVIVYSSALTPTQVQALSQKQLQYFAPPLPAAYVTKWYDQSGNGRDMVQTNPMMQPSIMLPPYGSNTVVPTISFNGSQALTSNTGMPTSANYSKVVVFSYNVVNTYNNIFSSYLTTNAHALYMANSNYLNLYQNTAFYVTSTLPMAINTMYSTLATYTETSPAKAGVVYRGNAQGGTGTTASSNTDASLELGAYNDCCFLFGTISEAMVFARSLSAADRTAIYTDEQNYFSSQ